MLVPQTASKARIQIIAAFYNGTVEKEYEITATLPATTTWKAGEQITYNLDINLDKGYMNLTPTTITTYSYTGGVQTFTAPSEGYYQLEAWGAKGGFQTGFPNSGWAVGSGGYVKGTLYLKQSQKIHVYVGEFSNRGNVDGSLVGSWNGGGGCMGIYSGMGGGATDFRLKDGAWNSAQGLNSRIMVAGGGGGSGNRDANAVADRGHAGGLNGYNSKDPASMGGTQINGGSSTAAIVAGDGYSENAKSGTFGAGGYSGTLNYCGGGGGGYYGGAGNGYRLGGQGSGGSSFISGMTGCIAINPNSTSEPRAQDSGPEVVKTMLNYNNATFGASPTWPDGAEIIFTNCSMIDGAGYEWNTGAKGASVTLPANPDGDKGYARITKLNKQ
jgi:hypothetical protein